MTSPVRPTNRRVNMISPDGRAVSIAADRLQSALAQGYRQESAEEASINDYVDDNKGIKGALKVGVGQFVDETLGGALELAADNVQSDLDRKKREALKKEHEVVNTIAGVAGFGASMAAGGWVTKGLTTAAKGAGVASRATQIASKLNLDKVGKIASAENLTGKITTAALTGTKEAVDYVLPSAIAELATGDPQGSAEVLASSIGIGAFLGAAGKAAKLGTEALAPGLAKSTTKGKNVWNYLTENPNDLTQDLVQRAATSTALYQGAKAAGVDPEVAGTLAAVGGVAGKSIRLGKLVTKYGDDVAKTVDESVMREVPVLATDRAQQLVRLAERKTAADIAGIKTGQAINDVQLGLAKQIQKADELGSEYNLRIGMPGFDTKAADIAEDLATRNARILDSQKKLETLQARQREFETTADELGSHITKLAQQTESRVASIPQVVERMRKPIGPVVARGVTRASISLFNDLRDNIAAQTPESIAEQVSGIPNLSPEEQAGLTAQLSNTVQFLQGEMPMGRPATQFNPIGMQPSDSEKAQFIRKAQIANDPYLLIERLGNGTLTNEEVQTVKTLYPKLYQTIQTQFMQAISSSPKPLNYHSRLKLQMLLEMPLTGDPAFYQKTFETEDEQQQGGQNQRLKGQIPSPAPSTDTSIQNLR